MGSKQKTQWLRTFGARQSGLPGHRSSHLLHTLTAAACIGGRAVPLVWASYPGSKLRRSQSSLEARLLRKLKVLPPSCPVTILADRGFGRAEWAAVCQELGFHDVVRIKPDVTIACPRYRAVLSRDPTTKGMAHVLRGVDSREDKRVKHNVGPGLDRRGRSEVRVREDELRGNVVLDEPRFEVHAPIAQVFDLGVPLLPEVAQQVPMIHDVAVPPGLPPVASDDLDPPSPRRPALRFGPLVFRKLDDQDNSRHLGCRGRRPLAS